MPSSATLRLRVHDCAWHGGDPERLVRPLLLAPLGEVSGREARLYDLGGSGDAIADADSAGPAWRVAEPLRRRAMKRTFHPLGRERVREVFER